jgi:hypothetical protein
MVRPNRKPQTILVHRVRRRRSYHRWQVLGLTLVGWLLVAWIWLPSQPPHSTSSISAIASLIHHQGRVGLEPVAQAMDTRLQSGTQVRLNGQLINGAWQRRAEQIGLADTFLAQRLGLDPLNTNTPEQQPINWFTTSDQAATVLPAWHSDNVRYLDITALKTQFNWQVNVLGNILEMTTQPSQILTLRQGRQAWGDRVVIDLSQPATWQVDSTPDQVTVAIEAAISSTNDFTAKPGRWLKTLQITPGTQRTVLTATTTQGGSIHAWSLSNPYRLVLDFRQDPLQPRAIQWAPGIRWQQQYLALGSSRFPRLFPDLESWG